MLKVMNLIILGLVISSVQIKAAQITSGVTKCTPRLHTSRFDTNAHTKAMSLFSLTAGLMMRPKEAIAAIPPSIISSTVTTSLVTAVEKIAVVGDEETLINSLISGASTRVAKELVLHPIDTVRARLQKAPDQSIPTTNSDEIIPSGLNQEGLFDNLYDGLLPALVGGVPAGALFFGVKDYSKKKFRKMGLGKQESTILSVMITNVPYWVVRTPSEVLKTRRQIGYDNSSSVTEMMSKMVQQEGGVLPAIKSTYGSYASNFAYALPADIIKFLAYETLTSSVLGIKEGAKIQGLQAAVTGAAASLVAQAVTTPLDVVRTRIMSRTDAQAVDTNKITDGIKDVTVDSSETTNPITELLSIAESEGPRSLFSGLLPRAVRALASGGIQFASYELTQNALLSR